MWVGLDIIPSRYRDQKHGKPSNTTSDQPQNALPSISCCSHTEHHLNLELRKWGVLRETGFFSKAAQRASKQICIIFRAAPSLRSVFCIHISLSNRDSFLYAHLGQDQGGGELLFFFLFFLVCLLKAIVSFTPVELIAETSGGPFSSASQFSLLCLFLPVGGLSCNSNISSSRGNGERPQRQPQIEITLNY